MQPPPPPENERVVYQAAFESLIRGAGAEQDPELAKKLAEVCGYDMRRPKREYKPDVLRKVIDLLSAHCFPDSSQEAAYEALGRQSFRAYRTTLVGRVVMAALSMASIPRALQLATRGFRTVSNYSLYELIPGEGNHLIYRARNTTLPPPYTKGMLGEVMAGSNHHNVTIEFDATRAPEQVDYHVSW